MEVSSIRLLIARVRVVPRRTVVGDIDRRFDNLSGSHHQSHEPFTVSDYLLQPGFRMIAAIAEKNGSTNQFINYTLCLWKIAYKRAVN